MDKNKNKIFDEYMSYHDKYSKVYKKMSVFMQVGSFFEAYAIPNYGPNLDDLSQTINVVKTRKHKKTVEVTRENPNFVGFPVVSKPKYLKILIDNDYTIILVEQVTPAPNPTREITGIYSAGTYIEDISSPDSNNIMSIYIEEIKQINSAMLMCIGMTVIDLSTGKSIVHEVYSSDKDCQYALDEVVRFINCYYPKEFIIHKKSNTENITKEMNLEKIITYLELENKSVTILKKLDRDIHKISYQEEHLRKSYPSSGLLSAIEYTDLETRPYALISLIIILNFSYEHINYIIKNLKKPEIFCNNKHLILGNNAIMQLNILECHDLDTNKKKFKSLFDVVCNTSTSIGRRYLKDYLINPKISEQTLENMYNYVEEMIRDKQYVGFELI